jgi:magnesium chelatase family protein
MVIKTLFRHLGAVSIGEVELQLLPGIPQLSVVGQPDTQIRECGIKLKAALRAASLKWPSGNQIVVNLRPAHFRKTSPGVELAIALGLLKITGQLPAEVADRLGDLIVYGEFTLEGKICAPHDFVEASRFVGSRLLTGPIADQAKLRHGVWEMPNLAAPFLRLRAANSSLTESWKPPESLSLDFHPAAADSLWLSAHAGLNVLLAGPQGTGKTTWTEALYALTDQPTEKNWCEREAMFGKEMDDVTWRPFERPHHSVSALGMVGGGTPIRPGVISRAHGGLLIMDEFLEFSPRVLEALREPVESGYIELARGANRRRFPADFQLVATTNLCPCGRLNPASPIGRSCSYALPKCRSICARMSGPVLDRFDILLLSHLWAGREDRVPFQTILDRVKTSREFAAKRGTGCGYTPAWVNELPINFRRRRSLFRVARAWADLDQAEEVEDRHFTRAFDWVETPMAQLAQIFG